MSTMELVADLKFLLTSNEAWEHLRNFGFLQQVTGENGQHLDYIKQSRGATVTMKPRNMNLKEGLSFTIKHHRLDEIREAASLLHSLLEKIQIDFKEYLGNRRVPKNAVDFEMETNQARCGKCKKDFSTLFDLEDHTEEHNAPRPPPVTTATKKVEESPSEPSTTTSTTTSNTYTAWPGNNKSENGKTTQGANVQENSAEEFINFSNVFQKAKSPGNQL